MLDIGVEVTARVTQATEYQRGWVHNSSQYPSVERQIRFRRRRYSIWKVKTKGDKGVAGHNSVRISCC